MDVKFKKALKGKFQFSKKCNQPNPDLRLRKRTGMG